MADTRSKLMKHLDRHWGWEHPDKRAAKSKALEGKMHPQIKRMHQQSKEPKDRKTPFPNN
jgi:hypothetical protein